MEETSSIDAGLLARIAQRDAQALELLYERHAKQVFSLGLAMLHDREQATDLTQEVFLLVWRHAGAYRPSGTPRSWLLRLTRNRAIDELRRQRRRHQTLCSHDQDRLQTPPVPTALTFTVQQREVRQAVEALPDSQREALLLAFFLGLSHQEIATQLQTPLGTVKARIRRALITLRQRFDDKETLS